MRDDPIADQLAEFLQAWEERAVRLGYYMPALSTYLRVVADEMADRYPDDVNGGHPGGKDGE